MTRSDLAWAYHGSELSKFVQYPGAKHMAADKHAFGYLRGTFNQSIHYRDSRDDNDSAHARNVLWGWVDSDWAADVETRRSHTGYILMLSQWWCYFLEVLPPGFCFPVYF